MRKKVLVVGGAGYIGSHTCLLLAERGYEPVVFDNLSNGHEEFVRWGPFEHGDIRDKARLDKVFAKHKPEAVLHFAALIEVGESVKNPAAFYDNNVTGALTLLTATMDAGVKAFVFSSTCATYGLPERVPLDEVLRRAGRLFAYCYLGPEDWNERFNDGTEQERLLSLATAGPEGIEGRVVSLALLSGYAHESLTVRFEIDSDEPPPHAP